MSGQFKTRKVTPGGRLVTQAQLHAALQGAADKIAAHVANAFVRLEQHTEARLARIEKELGLSEMPVGPVLVKDDTTQPGPSEDPQVPEIPRFACSACHAEVVNPVAVGADGVQSLVCQDCYHQAQAGVS